MPQITNLTLLVSLLLGAPQVQCTGGSLGALIRDWLFYEVVRMDRAADAVERLARHVDKDATPANR